MRKTPQETDRILLILRTSPLGPKLPFPAEILFGRKVRSNLPVHLQGKDNDTTIQKRGILQMKSEANYNQHSHKLPELQMNQAIFFQDVARKTWMPGVIIGYGPEPRSYTILCSSTGRSLRRNRVLIRPRSVTFADRTAQELPRDTIVSCHKTYMNQHCE